MTPKEIRAQLILRGIRQRDIAIQLGVRPSSISQVINRKAHSTRIEWAIARALGKARHDVFPEDVA